MIDLLATFLPLALPVAFAVLAGRRLSGDGFWWVGSLGLVVASLYPLFHWYVLHYGFGMSANTNDKDDVVGSSVIWLAMLVEVPTCFMAYLISRSVGRNVGRSYCDR